MVIFYSRGTIKKNRYRNRNNRISDIESSFQIYLKFNVPNFNFYVHVEGKDEGPRFGAV